MPKYRTVQDNEWYRVRLRNQKEACCDCSLVHNLDFKIVIKGKRKYLYARARRNNRATAAMRAHDKKNLTKNSKV